MENLKNYIVKLKAAADESRMIILRILSENNEVCSCEIEKALNMSQPAVSQHLLKLKNANLIKNEKRGKWRHYYITKEGKDFLKAPLADAVKKIKIKTKVKNCK